MRRVPKRLNFFQLIGIVVLVVPLIILSLPLILYGFLKAKKQLRELEKQMFSTKTRRVRVETDVIDIEPTKAVHYISEKEAKKESRP